MKYAGLGAAGLVAFKFATPLLKAQDLACTADCVPPPTGGLNTTYVVNHSKAHSSLYNALLLNRAATPAQVSAAQYAANLHFNNLNAIGTVAYVQNAIQKPYVQPTDAQFQAVYNTIVNTYGTKIPFTEAKLLFQPDLTAGQNAFQMVRNVGAWPAYQAALTLEEEMYDKYSGTAKRRHHARLVNATFVVPIGCAYDANNVENMFMAIAALFTVVALIDPPALGVAAAAGLVAAGAHIYGAYC
jgi:hypothetical protein